MLLGAFGVLWLGALLVGSVRLETALNAIKAETRYASPIPMDFNQPGPGENGAPCFAAAFSQHGYWNRDEGRIFHKVLAQGWNGLGEDEQVSVRGWLAAKKEAFELAAQGAERPWCRYSRRWREEPWNVWAFEQSGVAVFGRSLVVRASMQVADGDTLGARGSIRLAFAVADSLRDEPTREVLSSRLALHQEILKNLMRMIPADLTVAECDEWARLLPAPGAFDGNLERAFLWDLHVVSDLLSGPMDRFWHAWADRNPHRRQNTAVPRRLSDPLAVLDGSRALEDLQRMIDATRKPYAEARIELHQMWVEDHGRSRGWNPVRRTFVHPSPYYLDLIQLHQSLGALIRVGLEWEKARSETGKYPERCESIDPCTGAPFLVEAEPRRLTGIGQRGHISTERNSWVLRK